jgi:signal transduction histidine kinase/DNA-binding response OmpR family regulator
MSVSTLMIVFDLVIFGAYFSIPVQLCYFLCRSQHSLSREIRQVIYLFATFIVLCGLTHLLACLNVETLLVIVKGICGAVSWFTSYATWRVIPVALELPQYTSSLEEAINKSHHEVSAAKKATQAADRSKNEVEKFMAFVCHEIRNPLQVITATVEFLTDTTTSRLTQEQKDCLLAISSSSTLMVAIVNDVLDLSRLNAGKLQLEHLRTDICKLLQGLVRSCQARAVANKLELKLHIDDNVPTHVITDPTRLLQVLLNLLSNALKFTPAHGRIDVSLRAVSATPKDNHPNVQQNAGNSTPPSPNTGKLPPTNVLNDSVPTELMFCIADTGVGISPTVLPKLFIPFSQAQGSVFRESGGSGLGLSICKRLVMLLGGTINVESALHQGSRFTVCVPLIRARTPPLRSSIPTPILSSLSPASENIKHSILVVDDQPLNCKVIERMVRSAGFNCDLAADGTQALTAVEANPNYSVIIMDINMPKMNGIEATVILRSRGYQMPIVALTGSSLVEEKQQALNSGMSSYISKPIQRHELLKILSKYVLLSVPPNPTAVTTNIPSLPPLTLSNTISNATLVSDNEPEEPRELVISRNEPAVTPTTISAPTTTTNVEEQKYSVNRRFSEPQTMAPTNRSVGKDMSSLLLDPPPHDTPTSGLRTQPAPEPYTQSHSQPHSQSHRKPHDEPAPRTKSPSTEMRSLNLISLRARQEHAHNHTQQSDPSRRLLDHSGSGSSSAASTARASSISVNMDTSRLEVFVTSPVDSLHVPDASSNSPHPNRASPVGTSFYSKAAQIKIDCLEPSPPGQTRQLNR